MSIQTNLSRDDSMMLNLEPERPPQLGTDEMDSGVPVNVYTDPANVSEEEAKRMLPRLFAMQKAQSAQIQLLQDQLGSETRRRVVADVCSLCRLQYYFFISFCLQCVLCTCSKYRNVVIDGFTKFYFS